MKDVNRLQRATARTRSQVIYDLHLATFTANLRKIDECLTKRAAEAQKIRKLPSRPRTKSLTTGHCLDNRRHANSPPSQQLLTKVCRLESTSNVDTPQSVLIFRRSDDGFTAILTLAS